MLRNFEQLYEELGVKVRPLNENYSPEDYGRELMKDVLVSDIIVYSTSTNYIQESVEQKINRSFVNRM